MSLHCLTSIYFWNKVHSVLPSVQLNERYRSKDSRRLVKYVYKMGVSKVAR